MKPILLSVLFLFLSLVFISLSPENGHEHKQVHRFPKGFIGRVLVVYNEKNGFHLTEKDGVARINFPSCGALKFDSSFSSMTQFDVVIADGDFETRIPIVDNDDAIDSTKLNSIVAMNFLWGSLSFHEFSYKRVICYYIDTLKNNFKYNGFGVKEFGIPDCLKK